MVKIISNEEYAKLKEDVDYWKTLATTSVKRVDEYNKLDKEKVTFVSFGEVKSLRKARKIAEEFRKTFKAWLFKSFLLLYTKGEKND